MKLHKKIKIGISEIGTFSAVTTKVKWIWSRNFGVTMRKIWAFIWQQKSITSGWALGDENSMGTYHFKELNMLKTGCTIKKKNSVIVRIPNHHDWVLWILHNFWKKWFLKINDCIYAWTSLAPKNTRNRLKSRNRKSCDWASFQGSTNQLCLRSHTSFCISLWNVGHFVMQTHGFLPPIYPVVKCLFLRLNNVTTSLFRNHK